MPDAPVRVLIMDDDPAIRRGYSGLLERAGCAVVSVSGPEEAMAALGKSSYDVIICDVILKGSEGTAFFEDLRESHPAAAERVLFITGWAGEDEKTRKLVEHTGRPFLAKPVERDRLVKMVQMIASR